ncbi:condensation domain-containing protein [Micromonospora sp. M12]
MLHHLVVDGVSWRVLMADLAQAADAALDGRLAQLPPVPSSYRGWALDVRAHATDPDLVAQLPGWTAALEGAPAAMFGRALSAADTAATARELEVEIGSDTTAALLSRAPAAVHGTVEDVLLAAFAIALTDWHHHRSGTRGSILLDLESHGRDSGEHTDLSRTVGWFTSIFPVRLDPGSDGLVAAVKRVRSSCVPSLAVALASACCVTSTGRRPWRSHRCPRRNWRSTTWAGCRWTGRLAARRWSSGLWQRGCRRTAAGPRPRTQRLHGGRS